MTSQGIISIIMDCDDTLCSDSTNFLLSELGIEPQEQFWPRVTPKIQNGWDPPLAYIDELVKVCKEREILLDYDTLCRIGKNLKFFSGVPGIFDELHLYVERLANELGIHLQIEYYIISSGFEELISNSIISPKVADVFACTLEFEGQDRRVVGPKSIVTFTEKTKFIFAINKGITKAVLRSNPGSVNDEYNPEERRIPLRNMIYMGDGPTDIPCFSVVTQSEGKGIGIIKPERPEKGEALWKGKRLTVGPYSPDYKAGTDLRIMLEQMIKEIASGIYQRSKFKYK